LCHYIDDIALVPGYCPQNEGIDVPNENPLNGDLCISDIDYFAIYEHNYGPDCTFGTEDDGMKDQYYCPPGFEYDFEWCHCLSTDFCPVLCADGL
jgi:hypothetical protein